MFSFRAVCTAGLSWVSMLVLAGTTATAQHYTRTDLTQNMGGVSMTAANTDPNLVNAWGLSRGSGSPWWISDNGTGLSTLYDASGSAQALVVTIPPPAGQNGPATPTGTAFNFTGGFNVAPGKPAIFLFVTEDGTISAWNPGVDATHAILKVDRSRRAIYKGCAVAMTPRGPRLYATNFMTGGVDVFDTNFHRIPTGDEAFEPRGRNYAPFGIQNVGGNLVVTFAKRLPGQTDELHGPGLGQAAVFDVWGRTLQRLQNGPWFNAPWGVALAPSDFGAFSHRLLIGNFGDGTIHAFDLFTGMFEGTLLDATSGQPTTIDGLWALEFAGDSQRNGLSTELYFTAGPNDENNGLFGKLSAIPTEQRGTSE